MTDSTDLHAVGCLLHLFPEVVGLGSSRLQVAGKSRGLGGLIIPADDMAITDEHVCDQMLKAPQ